MSFDQYFVQIVDCVRSTLYLTLSYESGATNSAFARSLTQILRSSDCYVTHFHFTSYMDTCGEIEAMQDLDHHNVRQ